MVFTAKEFTTEFNKPVLKDEKGRYYILEYEVDEAGRSPDFSHG